MNNPSEFLEWSVAIFLVALEVIILYLILADKIKLKNLINEENGDASLSRFQFLVFTFIVAGVYTVIAFANGDFPKVDAGTLGLLGISGGSYVISKGIQKNAEENARNAEASGNAEKPGKTG